ncbi:hypothetical protein SAMN05192583_2368 [Sphingomonas gellani]|uniref:DUF4350 domain-containing protein n=1 Tax=Sphingomonas gellani TaxID=1166340 RepID=A0A1H8EZV8_9SPHN|nr:hypothetical protein [Sphingomonas gellani]SEN24979.1 hypothetical protein SAMN05192583_2368 [Sphingomonas gellani]
MSGGSSTRLDRPTFRPAVIALLLVVGVVGFLGTLVLSAYAPDWRGGHNGGAHALSNGATGYAGLIRLAEKTGRNPRVVRDEAGLQTENLLVATPEHGSVDVDPVLSHRQGRVTLMVLPKWQTVPDKRHAGWVRQAGLLHAGDPGGVLAPATPLSIGRVPSGGQPLVNAGDLPPAITFRAPRPLQVIANRPVMVQGERRLTPGLIPIITDRQGHAVLVKVADRPVYILADPDLLNNKGMRRENDAASALALLDWLNSNEADGISFDVTLNGFARTRSPLKLALEPPFLAMTLAILAALLLVGWQATVRFGAPRRLPRAIAFGKAALIDNTAALIRKAGRWGMLGPRYAELARERAALAFGAPARLSGTELDAYLDRLERPRRFSELAAAAAAADTREAVLATARDLHDWHRGDRTQ